jgi:predicted RecB family nuclease
VEEFFLQRYEQCTRIIDPFDTKQTQDAINRGDAVIYQPVFQIDGLYARPDVLVKNMQGTYDCIEIKSKTSVRNKSIEAALYDELLYDISFQSYVLTKVL